jgi:hypothetical protein
MPAITKKSPRLKLEVLPNHDTSVTGGLIAVEALAQQFGLWPKLAALTVLDPRRDRSRGFAPEVIAGQIIAALCSGGTSLVDSERLNADPLAKQLFGVTKFADESQVGEWLRAQTDQGVAAVRALNRKLVAWIDRRVQRRRVQHGGQDELFFDDTQLEVSGKQFEGARLNYNGEVALSWQTLWWGPLLADSVLGSPGDCSDQLPALLGANRRLWKGRRVHVYADSASSTGVYLEAIANEGATARAAQWQYTVSYNKWTGPLEKKAQELPSLAWRMVEGEQFGFLRHQPDGCVEPKLFACVRRKDDLLWRYGFVACDESQGDAARVFERHALKGDKERLFSEVLSGLDLHHPPCLSLRANQMFYALAMVAYNLLQAIKLLELPDDCQGWRLKTLLAKLVLLPVRMGRRSRQAVARLLVPVAWLAWWQQLVERLWPRWGVGRPPLVQAWPSG